MEWCKKFFRFKRQSEEESEEKAGQEIEDCFGKKMSQSTFEQENREVLECVKTY